MAKLEEIQAFKEKAKASGRDDLVARADAKIAQMTAPQQPQEEGYVEYGVAPASKPEISPVDYLIGLGEIGRMMASGTFQGMPAGVGTFIGQAAGAMKQGEFGEPQAAQNIMESTASAMGEATYAPKTEAAQKMLKGLEPLSQLPITLGMGGAPGAAIRNAGMAAAPAVAGKVETITGADVKTEYIPSMAEKSGIKVMTSDVFPPKTAIGKGVQKFNENNPFSFVGKAREQQYDSRVSALKNILDEYGAMEASNASDEVMKDMLKKRGDQFNKYSKLKSDVMTGIDTKTKTQGKKVDMKATLDAVDQRIAELSENSGNKAVAEFIQDLEEFKGNISDKSLSAIENERKLLGEKYSPEKGEQRKLLNDSTPKLYGAFKEDMGRFIKENGSDRDYLKWRIADKNLSKLIGEEEITVINTLLKKGEDTPEVISNILFSKKPSEQRLLYKSLSPEGRANARVALLHKAAKDSMVDAPGGVEQLSPEKFITNYKKISSPLGQFMTKEKKAELDGLVRLVKLTDQSTKAGLNTPTGQQTYLTGLFSALGFTAAKVGIPETAAALATTGVAAKFYESPAVRNSLIRLSRSKKGSPEEKELYDLILGKVQKTKPKNETNKPE